mmetsp:Transcript_28359/g.40129  ORF Transcript_28359/g.40129 Transcript_28359/m.40129 type:complete len:86 (+) Transcript_28359:43-300(+)
MVNILNPAWYSKQVSGVTSSLTAYYRPLFRAGSCKPLWHFMALTSIVMYTATQLGHKQKTIQAVRGDKKKALDEYYEKHGNPHAH